MGESGWGAGVSILVYVTREGLSKKKIICVETEIRSQLCKELRKENSRQKEKQNEPGTFKECVHNHFCSTFCATQKG